MATSSFCQAPESVIATAKPYRELALRPNDLEALTENYRKFLNSLSATIESQPEMAQEQVPEALMENTVVEEVPAVENNNIISDIPKMVDVQPTEVNEHQDIVPPEGITINHDEIPGFEPTPIAEQPIMVESSVINDFSKEESKTEEIKEEPVAVVSEEPQTIETTTVNENNANIIDFPQLKPENEKTDSVTDSYTKRFNDLMNRVSQTNQQYRDDMIQLKKEGIQKSQQYQEEMDQLEKEGIQKSQQFQEDMNQLTKEGTQLLDETKSLRIISLEAYEKAQNIPGIEQEKDNELSLTKAA